MSLAAYFDFRLFLDQICKKKKGKRKKNEEKRKKRKETEHKKTNLHSFPVQCFIGSLILFDVFFMGLLSAVFVSFV